MWVQVGEPISARSITENIRRGQRKKNDWINGDIPFSKERLINNFN